MTQRVRGALLAIALAWAFPLEGLCDAQPDERLVMQLVSVSGRLELVRDAGAPVLELVSDLDGRYRIDASGRGAALLQHVGERVSVVAFVDLNARDDRPLLSVEHFKFQEGDRS